MSKIMLVNVTHVEESRVAILEDGVLAAYEIETLNRTHIKGNIYNAVVETAYPPLEAAFLRIGSDLKGFLPLDEVNFKLLPVRSERGKGGRIGQHLRAGQRLMVQVVREPFAGKPPTVSTYFSLPGRYLVLMPGVESAGISRKIADGAQREQLKKIIGELRPPEGFGLIVRTAGLGQTKVELQRDLRYLLRLWESIQRASLAAEFPSLVYREHDLVIRTIRDYFTPDIREVWIDSKDTFERALEFVRDVMPNKAKILRIYTGQRPLFNKFNLEEQIESIYKRRVTLESGGEIVIDGTEALTAIDVNSARSQHQRDAEENSTQTNVEAAAEIARQLRLRDLGGLVVVDFIDMLALRNKKKVEKAMREAMRGDKAKYDITPISKLGLMEIARQRIKGEKMRATYAACPACDGYGLVKNVEAAALAALRKLQTRCARGDAGRIKMNLPTEVAIWILNHKREGVSQIERRHNLRIDVEPSSSLLRHESEFESFPREQIEEPQAQASADRPLPPLPPDSKLVEQVVQQVEHHARAEPAPTESEQEPSAAQAPRKRRRRRRRHSQAGVLAGADEPGVGSRASGNDPALKDSSPGHGKQATADPAAPGLPGGKDLAGEPGTAGAPRAEKAAPEDQHPGAKEEPPAGRKRRRRRRRRRQPQVASASQTGDREAPHETQNDPPRNEGPVPPGIRSNELLPAAAGGARTPKKAKSAGRSRNRRERSRLQRATTPPRGGEED